MPSRISILRAIHSALDVLGFRELTADLWLRPDNLAGGVADVRRRLLELGLEPAAIIFALSEMDGATDARARGLWDMTDQRAEYDEVAQAIERAIRRVNTMPREEAMVETFLLGGRVLRLLAFDPLLPDDICPGTERRRLAEVMREYDRRGRDVWTQFMRARNGPDFESVLPFPAMNAAASAAVGGLAK